MKQRIETSAILTTLAIVFAGLFTVLYVSSAGHECKDDEVYAYDGASCVSQPTGMRVDLGPGCEVYSDGGALCEDENSSWFFEKGTF